MVRWYCTIKSLTLWSLEPQEHTCQDYWLTMTRLARRATPQSLIVGHPAWDLSLPSSEIMIMTAGLIHAYLEIGQTRYGNAGGSYVGYTALSRNGSQWLLPRMVFNLALSEPSNPWFSFRNGHNLTIFLSSSLQMKFVLVVEYQRIYGVFSLNLGQHRHQQLTWTWLLAPRLSFAFRGKQIHNLFNCMTNLLELAIAYMWMMNLCSCFLDVRFLFTLMNAHTSIIFNWTDRWLLSQSAFGSQS